jgi:hypothetical protein
VNRASALAGRPRTTERTERAAEPTTAGKAPVTATAGAEATSDGATAREQHAIVALVDELASLAADLWFAGKLDAFPPEKEPADGDDD